MAEAKATPTDSKEYIIPLRREWLKIPRYRRAGRAIKAIKEYIAKHMKVPDRNTDLVRVDMYLNQEVWFKGRKSPPAKIKVKAHKEGDTIVVELAEMPKELEFQKARHEKRHKPAEQPKAAPAPAEAPAEEKTEEEKKDEEEKGKATEIQHAKDAQMQAKAQKHTIKQEKTQQPVRKALKK